MVSNPQDPRLVAFERLLHIMDDLRAKCPWDRKQTMATLRNLTIEETYELADAIAAEDLEGVKEELGDMMLHLVFYSKIGSETGAFDVADVINQQCEKMIRRHPHVYGDVQLDSADAVKQNWEKLKQTEGKQSLLSGIPDSLPAVVKALRMQDKTAQVGFEWDTTSQVMDKVHEELQELHDALQADDTDQTEQEFGDLLFALVNYARCIKVDPEMALARCNMKFKRRFQYIEQKAAEQNRLLQDMTLAEMDLLWNEAKGLAK
jgi:XTP/dITP diphosphohydrolase